MRTFDEIYAIAVERHGSAKAVETRLAKPNSKGRIAKIPGDRWLAEMTRSIFQAGFNWKVVDSMWPGFEDAFDGFDVARCTMLNDDDIDRLAKNEAVVRYPAKIRSVQENAVFLAALAKEHGSVGKFFAASDPADYAALLQLLKTRGSRLGGQTAQYFLRSMGVDGYILSKDVVGRLVAEGVIDKAPTSARAMAPVQEAFNTWRKESGRSLTEISRVLALSMG